MHPFSYAKAATAEDAAGLAARNTHAEFIAGGTDLLQLLKERVRTPSELIDITGLPFGGIEDEDGGGLRIGAMVRMSGLADDARVRRDYPLIAAALLESASPQVRNLATIGGNLLQRTRCPYFRDVTTPCNRREPGSGCSALGGLDRMHAILGTSEHCIAVHPSDLAVALVALDAVVAITGPAGAREVAMEDFHRLPGDTPHLETVLEPGELITAVRVPASRFARRSHYLKLRNRASFEWALVSAAVALDLGEDGAIRDARVAVGGVATKPWRLREVEAGLVGRPGGPVTFGEAAGHDADAAVPRRHNGFKVALVKRTVARALALALARSGGME